MHIFLYFVLPILICLLLMWLSFLLGIGVGISYIKKKFFTSIKNDITKKRMINSVIEAIAENDESKIVLH